MNNKIGIAIVVIIVFGLVVSLGYVVSQNSGGILNVLRMPQFARPGVTEVRNSGSSGSSLKILAPAGGESLTQGTVYTLRWQGGGSQVSLSIQKKNLFSGNSSAWSVSNVRNTGSYIFYVSANFSGSYTFMITDGDRKAISRPFTVQQGTASSGWTLYVDSQNLFELQYPAKINTSALEQKNAYPQKQYGLVVPDFVRATRITSAEPKKRFPALTLLVFKSNSMDIGLWLDAHKDIKRGYSSQALKAFNGLEFYKFSTVKQDVTYKQGKAYYRDRKDVPQEMYVAVSGAFTYVILVDFGSTGKYTILPEDIIKTFKIR